MRAVLQRVSIAAVKIDGREVSRISKGILVLIAASRGDGNKDIQWMAEKICGLRIFADEHGKMNLSVADVGGSILVVSQFTLYGDCRKGKRPSYTNSAPPDEAKEIYREFLTEIRKKGVPVEEGVFGAMMEVELANDGPVTLILDSPEK